jgi:hypothetical protein
MARASISEICLYAARLSQYRHGDSNPRPSRSSKPNSALKCGFSTALDRCQPHENLRYRGAIVARHGCAECSLHARKQQRDGT